MNTKIIIAIVLLVIVLAVGGYFLFKPSEPVPVAPPTAVDEEAQFDAALALLGGGSGSGGDLVEEFTTKECDDVLNDFTKVHKIVEASNSIGQLKQVQGQLQRMDKEIIMFKDCPRVGPAYRNFKRMVVKKFQYITKDLCGKLSTILKQYTSKAKQAKNLAQVENILKDEFEKGMRKVVDLYDLGGPNTELIFTICPNMKNEYLSFMRVVIAKRLQFNNSKVRKEVSSLCVSLKKLLAQVKSVKTQEQYNLAIDNLKRIGSHDYLLSMCIEYFEIMMAWMPLQTKFHQETNHPERNIQTLPEPAPPATSPIPAQQLSEVR